MILCYLKRTQEITPYVLSSGPNLREGFLYIDRKLGPVFFTNPMFKYILGFYQILIITKLISFHSISKNNLLYFF